MSNVPTIRPYATREEWRRDFHVDSATHRASSQAGLASIMRDTPTHDVWDVLDRETGEYLPLAVMEEVRGVVPRVLPGGVAYNRRTGEVVYGGGVQS